MSKRLQVMLQNEEYSEIEAISQRKRMTVSEWVRQALRSARQGEPLRNAEPKLGAVRAALRHEFPTADIDAMLAEIETGYASRDR